MTLAVEEKEVVKVAFNDAKAPVEDENGVPVDVRVPLIGVPPFKNCTVPVGAAPLLCVFTTAVRVKLAPDWTVDGSAVRPAVVTAGVMVITSALEALGL